MNLLTNEIYNCLTISLVVSSINMTLIQKLKSLSFITSNNQIFLMNAFMAFLIGIPFSLIFYKIELCYAIWVGIFSFIGAPSIYSLLKTQNIINYTPKALQEKSDENENQN
jgi:hypothetical protein